MAMNNDPKSPGYVETEVGAALTDRQICLLSLVFNRYCSAHLDVNDAFAINKWIEGNIQKIRGVK